VSGERNIFYLIISAGMCSRVIKTRAAVNKARLPAWLGDGSQIDQVQPPHQLPTSVSPIVTCHSPQNLSERATYN
jgi:hypothetical protein